MKRVPGVTVTPYHGKIQDKDGDYYLQFNIIICGLDSVEARRWMSATLVNLVDEGDMDNVRPLIDGGTEGFRGQSRVILPSITSCYECSLDMLNKPTAFPICTIANTPRLPEHCIEWASVLEWPKVHGSKKMDTDDPEHIGWLYQVASARAREFKIEGVTWSLTQGVVKNIIPAIASTNAVIAAACANEAFKFATNASGSLNNYMMYVGNSGVYSYTFEYERDEKCLSCSSVDNSIDWTIDPEIKVIDFMEELGKDSRLQLGRPSIRCQEKNYNIYLQGPPMLEKKLRPNLEKAIGELIEDGMTLNITAPTLPGVAVHLKMHFQRK